MDELKRTAMKHRGLILAALLAATAAVYIPALDGPFLFDDIKSIAENPVVKAPFELKHMVSGSRPLTTLSFGLNYAMAGMEVKGYHILNLLAHLVAVLLVFFFFRSIFISSPDSKGVRAAEGRALIIASVFALHPLQTGAVSYVVQRAEVLASLMYLLSLFCFVRYTETAGRASFGLWLLAVSFFIAGYGFKEIIVTAPVMLLLYLLFFGSRAGLKKAALGTGAVVLAGAAMGIRIMLGLRGNKSVGFSIEGIGQTDYGYTQLTALLTYLRMLFLPVNQNIDHDYPLRSSLFEPAVLASAIFLVVIVAAAFATLKVSGRYGWPLRRAGFGMLWFLLILMPTSSVVPLKDLIFEHRVYLAMAGIALVVVSLGEIIAAHACSGRPQARTWPGTFALIVLLLLASLTFGRNTVWGSKTALWQDAAAKSPAKARVHYNLGVVLQEQGRYQAAIESYLKAVRLNPEYGIAYTNLGSTYLRAGMREEGLSAFRKASQLAGKNELAHFNLGVTYLDEALSEEAEAEFKTALQINPSFAPAKQFLQYIAKGRPQR